MRKPLQYITIILFALASVLVGMVGCKGKSNAVVYPLSDSLLTLPDSPYVGKLEEKFHDSAYNSLLRAVSAKSKGTAEYYHAQFRYWHNLEMIEVNKFLKKNGYNQTDEYK
jgi:hypothetical protein